ncbi:MAG: glycoside hydrolase family 20 zincin-like fold domain-containing protein, partial [Kiritimatiellia bacterium]|nr:glycoside hydrolase family 20 zincin-like fold domain-containing protein [Kiritimatiellia bacterium]
VVGFAAADSPWTIRMDSRNDGPGFLYNENRISHGAYFICASPDWKEHFFWMERTTHRVETAPQSVRITSDPDPQKTAFHMEAFALESTDRNRLRISVRGRLTKFAPAITHYIPLVIPPDLLEGATVETEQETFTVPLPDAGPMPDSKPARRFIITGPRGDWSFTVNHGAALQLKDRRDRPFLRRPCFLFIAEPETQPIQTGELFEHQIILTVHRGLEPLWNRLPKATPSLSEIGFEPARPLRLPVSPGGLFPAPREIRTGDAVRPVPEPLTLAAPAALRPDRLARRLTDALAWEGRIRTVAVTEAAADAWLTVHRIPFPEPDRHDYFEWTADASGVRIAAATPAAALYAVGSLAQWLGKADTLRDAEVRDWASFAYRGIHLLACDYSQTLHPLLIRHLFGPLRINHLLLESNFLKWSGHPELHRPWGMPLEDVALLREAAAEFGIQVSPLLQTWGHMEYLFHNGANPDLAEDPDHPYAYDVSNPRTYEVIGGLLAELRTLFPDGEWLHIGHDEVDMRGRYPHRPSNLGKTIPELLLQDLEFYRAHAAKENLRLMMWNDMLCKAGKLYRAERFIAMPEKPDTNIVMAVWDYRPDSALATPVREFEELAFLQDFGYPVIGATGEEDPRNIVNFSRYAEQRKALGMLHTTWTGYSGNRTALFRWPLKLWPYAQAGASFWNPSVERISAQHPSFATRAFDRVIASLDPQRAFFDDGGPIVPVRLDALANIVLEEKQGGFIPGPLHTPHGMGFHLADGGRAQAAAIRVAGVDETLSIPVHRRAKAISLLWTLMNNDFAVQREVGTLTMKTDRGTTVRPLVVGRDVNPILPEHKNINGLKQGRLLTRQDVPLFWPGCRPVFSEGGRFVLWQADFALGDEILESIELRAADGAVLAVAGLTLVEPGGKE